MAAAAPMSATGQGAAAATIAAQLADSLRTIEQNTFHSSLLEDFKLLRDRLKLIHSECESNYRTKKDITYQLVSREPQPCHSAYVWASYAGPVAHMFVRVCPTTA